MVVFLKRDRKARRVSGKKDYGRIVRTGMLAGALYGAELDCYSKKEVQCLSKKEVQCLKTDCYASACADVPWVPNYKYIVLGSEKAQDFLVNVASILACTR